MDKEIPKQQRVRRKSSAAKVGLSRSNTYSSSPSDELDGDSASFSTSTYSVPNLPTSSLGAQLDALKTTVNKRIATWSYLRSAHEGRVFWFNTVLLGQEELQAAFEHTRMRIRTSRFAILGMSLSALLDISAPPDFLRGLLSLMQEFDSVADDKFELDRKNRSVFRVTARPKRSNTSGADFTMGLPESGESSYLFTPNIPFELDYFQVLFTTCDILVEVYQKILSYLGASPGSFPSPPPTLISGISTNGTGTAGLSPALVEVVLKIDARLIKMISQLTKDVDVVARKSIKNELNSLSGGDWSLDLGVNDL